MSILTRPLLTVAGLLICASVADAQQAPAAKTPAPQTRRVGLAEPLNVMTFAVREMKPNDGGAHHWYHRREAVCKTINESGADIILLQDPVRSQLDEIKKNCTGYTVIEGQSGLTATTGTYAPILYKADKFKNTASEFFWFSAAPNVPSMGYGNAEPMICQRARFKEIASNLSFDVYNLKWCTTPVSARDAAAKQLARKIMDDNLYRVPFIVGGDFGAPVTDVGAAYLMTKRTPTQNDRYFLGLSEAFGGKSSPASYHMFGTGSTRTDLFLLGPYWTVREAKVIEGKIDNRYASDHYPVQMSVMWERVRSLQPAAPVTETKPAVKPADKPAEVKPADAKPAAVPTLTPATTDTAPVKTDAPAPTPAGDDDW